MMQRAGGFSPPLPPPALPPPGIICLGRESWGVHFAGSLPSRAKRERGIQTLPFPPLLLHPPPPFLPFPFFFFLLTLSVLRDVFKHTRAGMHECPLGTATCESRHCAVLSTLEPGHVIRQRVCIRMPTQAPQPRSRPRKRPAPRSAALHKRLQCPFSPPPGAGVFAQLSACGSDNPWIPPRGSPVPPPDALQGR